MRLTYTILIYITINIIKTNTAWDNYLHRENIWGEGLYRKIAGRLTVKGSLSLARRLAVNGASLIKMACTVIIIVLVPKE